jgi:hypothetical protein
LVLSAENFRWKARRRGRARQKSFSEVNNYARLSVDLQREARGKWISLRVVGSRIRERELQFGDEVTFRASGNT